jgi:NADPH:quinone reductase-like Zn-dependent oxidoreductase
MPDNNLIEQDHRSVKLRLGPMLGFKRFRNASTTIAGIELMNRRGRLRPSDVVLILGATGTSGLIAALVAKRLGAKRVIAVGRNSEALSHARELGADATVALSADCNLAAAFRDAAGGTVDVVLDYLNGAPAEAALEVMGPSGRMVQIGSILAPHLRLNSQLARKGSLDVLGFAYYHAPVAQQADAYTTLTKSDGTLYRSISRACPYPALTKHGTA